MLLTGCKSRRKLNDFEDPKKRTGKYVCPGGPGKYFCECVYIYKDGMVALFRLVTFMAASTVRTAISKILKEGMDMSTLCQVNPEVISPNYEVKMLARSLKQYRCNTKCHSLHPGSLMDGFNAGQIGEFQKRKDMTPAQRPCC